MEQGAEENHFRELGRKVIFLSGSRKQRPPWGTSQSSAKRRTDDLILSGRSFMKIKERTGPKIDPLGTPDSTGTGS